MKKIHILVISVVCAALGLYFARPLYTKRHVSPRPPVKKAALVTKDKKLLAKRRADWHALRNDIEKEMRGFNGRVSLVIKDLGNNWQIECDRDAIIPSASIVKIPIMMAYFYASNEGKIDLQKKIKINRAQKAPGSGLIKNMPPGTSLTIQELLYYMITHSDNTAANMLIDAFGIDRFDEYFKKLGLKHTNLSREMMDFKSRKSGVENYTTASDMAHLLNEMYYNRCLGRDTSQRCVDLLGKQEINDRIPKHLPQATVVAHKTGLETGICHDVGIVYTDHGNFLICALIKHNYKHAWEAKKLISKISLLTYNYYEGDKAPNVAGDSSKK